MTVTPPRLLVVSESRITRRVVEMTFADQEVDLVSASTGPDGLAEWQRHPAAIVVADLAMDGLDGLSLARQLHDAGGEHAPAVILLVGQSEHVDDAAMAAAGVRAVLRKPLDSLQLVDAVRAATRPGRPQDPPPAAMAMIAESAAPVDAAPALPPVVDAAPVDGPHAPVDLRDEDLERVAARVAAIWSGDVARVAPAAASEAAERLVRELAPQVIAEVARLVVADVSERLVREEIARMRAGHAGR
ncbi:MAG: response regulator [Vicinamibacterales bacterium]